MTFLFFLFWLAQRIFWKKKRNCLIGTERGFARKDVLLIPNQIRKLIIANYANKSKLHSKIAYAGRNAMFLGKCNETEYLKYTYYKKLIKQDFISISPFEM